MMAGAIKRLAVGLAGIGVVVLAALAVPALAPAATVQVTTKIPVWDNETALVFQAAPGEDNQVSVRIGGKADGYYALEVLDSGAPLTAGEGCSQGDAPGGIALCRMHETVAHEVCLKGCAPPQWGENWRLSMQIDLGDGNNAFLGSTFAGADTIPITVNGGPGRDEIFTGDGSDRIDPGAGSDEVRAGNGADLVETTAEPDGPDLYDLGNNNPSRFGAWNGDEISYERRSQRLEMRDGIGGADGEGDILLGYERLVGGSGDDLLEGGEAVDRLMGGPGEDELRGGGARDYLNGGPGEDELVGGAGRNHLVGDEDGDLLVGGPERDVVVERARGDSGDDVARSNGGADYLFLGAGDDMAAAGSGSDLVIGGIGRDRLRCGKGYDEARGAEGADELRGCEAIRRR